MVFIYLHVTPLQYHQKVISGVSFSRASPHGLMRHGWFLIKPPNCSYSLSYTSVEKVQSPVIGLPDHGIEMITVKY